VITDESQDRGAELEQHLPDHPPLDLYRTPLFREGGIRDESHVVVSQTVSQELLQPSTLPEPQVELRAGMQIRVNIQKSSDPKVREVRAKSHGVAGTIQVTGPDDLYTILCEDGQLRYFKAMF
jgi:multidrug efflux pump subunit AcrA (membrane-fusion protein)